MSTEDKIHGDTCGGDEKIILPGDLVSVKSPIDQQWWPDVVQDVSSNSGSISVNAGEKVCEWTELPLHIVDLISQYLPVEDVFRLGSVCKQWKDITRISRRRYGRPCFMYNTGRFIEDETQTTTTTTTNFFDLSRPDLDLPMRVPSYFHYSMILCSKDGWVLMAAEISKPKNVMFPFFFNPMTNVRIDLPEFEGVVPWGFSFSVEPTSSDCIVMSIQHMTCEWAVVRWCRRGEDHWEERELDTDVIFFGQLTNPIFHRGSFYCVGQGGKISVFNFENDNEDNPDVVWSVLPKPQVFDVGTEEYLEIHNGMERRMEIIRGTHKAYMVESDDNELLVVFVDLVDSIGVRGIRIYKMVMDSKGKGSWEEMKEIGGNFYLGNYGSLFHKGTTTSGESTFHFNIFKGRECISYRLRGDDYDEEEHMGRLVGRKMFPFGFWVDFDLSYPSSMEQQFSW